MRTPEEPRDSVEVEKTESTQAEEEKKQLTERLAEAIQKRTADSDGQVAVVFNDGKSTMVAFEVKDKKLIAKFRAHEEGVLIIGIFAFLEDGSFKTSGQAFYLTDFDALRGDPDYDAEGVKIDPTQPIEIENGVIINPLNTVVQIAEEGESI